MSEQTGFDPKSLLAVEVGSVNTRALFFDTVESRYRFIASGSAATTVGAPMHDASEGVRQSLDELQAISGRQFVGLDEQIITPVDADGNGAHRFVATLSAGQPIKAVAVGLLDKVSLQSARNLIGTINARLVEAISLKDQRQPEGQIDAILRARPDLIVIAGGSNNGANSSVLRLVNFLGMALELLPPEAKPEVLYVGNEVLAENVSGFIKPLASVSVAPNIRPSLKVEHLGPAELRLAEIYRKMHIQRTLGIRELELWAGGHFHSSSTAFGRVIRFLGKIYGPEKAVLGVDVGASSTTVAASWDDQLKLQVFSGLGVGEGIAGLLNTVSLEEISRWSPIELADSYLANYLYNKRLYPGSLPATREDLAIEQALAREAMQLAVSEAGRNFPKDAGRAQYSEALPWFQQIMVRGSVIARAPSLAQSLLMILDGLQPTGVIRRIDLDINSIAPAIGMAAAVNSVMAVQVLESNSFLNLGTVVAPVGSVRPGSPVLQVRVVYESGQEHNVTVQAGSLQRIPLPNGHRAELHLNPLQRTDIGRGPGRRHSLSVIGGEFGIMVDARGRPLQFSSSPEGQRERVRQSLLALQN